LIISLLGFLGFCSFLTASIPSAFKASINEAAAFFVLSPASGWVHTSTPTSPPSMNPFAPSSEYDHPATTLSAAWMRLAILTDSLESQYAVTVYACPL